MGKFHVSGDFLFPLQFFSDVLPVFLKYFLTHGQDATGYSALRGLLGFSTSDQWVINTGYLPYHLSQVEFSMQDVFKVCS